MTKSPSDFPAAPSGEQRQVPGTSAPPCRQPVARRCTSRPGVPDLEMLSLKGEIMPQGDGKTEHRNHRNHRMDMNGSVENLFKTLNL